jgi:hypothetical protein
MRLAGHIAWGNEKYKVLVGKPEGKRPIERPRHIWEDNILMYLTKIICKSVD